MLKGDDGVREMRDVRWGMPSSKKALLDAATKRAEKLRAKGKAVDFSQLLRMEPDKGTTNIRNTASAVIGGMKAEIFGGFAAPKALQASLERPVFASRRLHDQIVAVR